MRRNSQKIYKKVKLKIWVQKRVYKTQESLNENKIKNREKVQKIMDKKNKVNRDRKK